MPSRGRNILKMTYLNIFTKGFVYQRYSSKVKFITCHTLIIHKMERMSVYYCFVVCVLSFEASLYKFNWNSTVLRFEKPPLLKNYYSRLLPPPKIGNYPFFSFLRTKLLWTLCMSRL